MFYETFSAFYERLLVFSQTFFAPTGHRIDIYRQNYYSVSKESHHKRILKVELTLRENCPYSELFWSVFSTNTGEYEP